MTSAAPPAGTPAARFPLPGLSPAVAMLITLCALAFNLRVAMMAVPPLLETIQRDLGVSSAAAGFITTLPVLCFGLISPAAPVIARRLGLDVTLLLAVGTLAAGILVRIGQPVPALYLGTFLIGTGIAVMNVLIPAFIKRESPGRVGLLTSVYTMILNVGGTIGAATAVPVMDRAGWGWRPTLGIWVVPTLVGAALLVPWVLRRDRGPRAARIERRGLWGSPLAWWVTLAMGFQSMVFFGVASWLPAMLHDSGMDRVRAGTMLSLMTLAGLGGAFAAPMLANRRPDQMALGVVTAITCGVPLAVLTVSPMTLTVLWVLVLGFGLGMTLSLLLTLMMIRAPDTGRASDLSGMAQGVGYLMASTAPIIVGAINDVTGGWTLAFGFLTALLVPYAVTVRLAGRDSLVPGD